MLGFDRKALRWTGYRMLLGLAVALVGVAAGLAPAGAVVFRPIPTGTTGADISWPQCTGTTMGGQPSGASFGIVGVNDGLAGTENPCLSAELAWAATLSYHSPVKVYVNTADPGNGVADWPTTNPSGTKNPYGACKDVTRQGASVGADSQACAWAYGYNKAVQDVGWVPSPSSDHWWLDVETDNSWQSGKRLDLNEAVLDGMLAELPAHQVGVYSTSYQWNEIVGSTLDSHSRALGALAQWIPTGASSASTSDCSSLTKFTTGSIEYVQYTTDYDYDIACT